MRANILANLVGRFWGTISGFLLTPLYIHYLGFESFAVISFTLIIIGLLAVFDGGITATLSRELARADKSHREIVRIFSTLESIYLIVVGFCVFVAYSQAGFIGENWLGTEGQEPAEIAYFLKIISLDAGFQLLMRFYMGGLLGLEKQIKANVYQVGWGVLRNGFVVFALIVVPTLEIFFLWQVIVSAVFATLVRGALCNTLTGDFFYFKPMIKKVIVMEVWRFAAGMFLVALVAGINSQLDKLVISKLFPLEVLGYYTLCVSLAMGLVLIVNPVSVATLPRFTYLYSSSNYEEADILFQKVSLYTAILIFGFMANMMVSSEKLLWVWTGNSDLAANAGGYLPVITFSYAMLALAMIPYNIAIANGYTLLNNVLGISSLVVTAPGYWLVTKHYGAIGAAMVFCVVQTVTTLVFLYFVNKKFVVARMKAQELYFKYIGLPLGSSLLIAYGFSFIPDWSHHNRMLALTQIGFATCCTLLMTMFFLLPIKDIKAIFTIKPSNG